MRKTLLDRVRATWPQFEWQYCNYRYLYCDGVDTYVRMPGDTVNVPFSSSVSRDQVEKELVDICLLHAQAFITEYFQTTQLEEVNS